MSKSAFQQLGGGGGGGAGSVIGVVYASNGTQVQYGAVFTGTWVNTGLSITITPTNIANNIYIECKIIAANQVGASTYLRLIRGATPISVSGLGPYTCNSYFSGAQRAPVQVIGYDLPASVAPVTYTLQYSGSTWDFNGTAGVAIGLSQVIAMEVAR